MRFAVVPYGSVDLWRELALALALAGHRVEVHWPDRLDGLAGERYDGVFTMYVALGTVAAKTADPIVVMGWDAVFDELGALRAALAARPDGRLLYWIVCPAAAAFAATHLPEVLSFHLPLPVHPDLYLTLEHGLTLEAGSVAAHTIGIDAIIADLIRSFGEPDPAVVYLGRYDDPQAPLDLPAAMRRLPMDALIADGYRHFRGGGSATIVGWIAAQMRSHGLSLDADEPVVTGLYRMARKIVADVCRRPAVEALSRAFGERFWLYGDEWRAIGLPARPSRPEESHLRSLLYRRAGVSVDLGSNSLDTGWYARPMEILKYGGRLLQLRRTDSGALFGALAAETVHDAPHSLAARARILLDTEDPERRATLRHRALTRFDPHRIGDALARQVAG